MVNCESIDYFKSYNLEQPLMVFTCKCSIGQQHYQAWSIGMMAR